MAIDPLRLRGGKQTGPVSVASRMILKESEMNLPEGWPTEAMINEADAYAISGKHEGNYKSYLCEIFKIMYAAAPTPPAQDEAKYDSYLTNCCVIGRGETDSPLFVVSGDKVFCRLDRYTIIPTEQYDELRKAAEEAEQLLNGLLRDGCISGYFFGTEAISIRNNLRAALERK